MPSAWKRLPGARSRSGTTTSAPASSRRSASHEPMNPCAPVTRTVLPDHSVAGAYLREGGLAAAAVARPRALAPAALELQRLLLEGARGGLVLDAVRALRGDVPQARVVEGLLLEGVVAKPRVPVHLDEP